MKVIKNDRIVFVDVDGTLVKWDDHFKVPDMTRVRVKEPVGDGKVYLLPIERTARRIAKLKAQNYFVIVWSDGGWDWAEAVVQALGMEDFVDIVMTKPSYYIDDLPFSEWRMKWIPTKE